LFRRLNLAPTGTRALIDLRRQLLPTLSANPSRAPLDRDLTHLFRSWFNRGFLVLRRVDWQCPAAILEKLIQYERVTRFRTGGICGEGFRTIDDATPSSIRRCPTSRSFSWKWRWRGA
jgi:hypothetical protein